MIFNDLYYPFILFELWFEQNKLRLDWQIKILILEL